VAYRRRGSAGLPEACTKPAGGIRENLLNKHVHTLPSLLMMMLVLVTRLVYLSAAGVNYTSWPP
jgi:hypothetical protein